MEILPFLLAPFVASLILTGIHAIWACMWWSAESFSWISPSPKSRRWARPSRS